VRVLLALLALCAVLGLAVFVNWPKSPDPLPGREAGASPAPVGEGVLPRAEGSAVPAPRAAQPLMPYPPPPTAVPGELLLRVGDDAQAAAFARAARKAGIGVLGYSRPLGVLRLGVASGQEGALRDILPEGAALEYNHIVQSPEPPELGFVGLTPLDGPPGPMLGVPAGSNAGAGVKIAVLDTGVMPHSSLAQAHIAQVDLLGGGGYGTHGTATASIIAGSGTVQGIAPGSQVLAVRVLDAGGRGDTFTLAAGMVQAVNWGAQVIAVPAGTYGQSEALRSAVEYASDYGAVIVASAGNDRTSTPIFPAAYPEVIGVTSVDALNNVAPFGNLGGNVDIAAPGVGVPAAGPEESVIGLSGTSASAPIVAGVLAVAQSADSSRSMQETAALMLQNADDYLLPGPDPYVGAGIVNASRLLRAGTAGVRDIAVNDFYLSGFDEQGGNLNILVQNRGTADEPAAALQVWIGSEHFEIGFQALAPGGVDLLTLRIGTSALESEAGLRVEARIPPTAQDQERANNTRARLLRRVEEGK